MKIGGMTPFTHGELAGLRWNVSWEDSSRPDLEVYIAVPAMHGHLIAPNDHVSLLGALPTAARYGEKSITVPSADPWLLEGLEVVQTYFELWQQIEPVTIETNAVRSAKLGEQRGSAVFLSGGIDSLSTLRRNTELFPAGHIGRVTHALHVDLAGPEKLEDLGESISEREMIFVHSLEKAGADVGVEVVPVLTNLRALDGYDFNTDWMFHSHGTVLSAVAHAFDKAFCRVLIASSYDAAHLSPWGSHPLIDGRLSSSTFAITHHNEQYSRQGKVEIVAGWPAGLESLDVCFEWFDREAGRRNCGACEKCQRTIAGLMIAGVDPVSTGAFELTRFDAQTLGVFGRFADEYERESWLDIEVGLRNIGHPAAATVSARIRRDNLSKRLDNPVTRGLLKPAKAAYGLVRKYRK
ncbi:hypothetical protein HWD94_10775 [Pseudarthrobacter equi]|uniref:hypothetical protein n=1 Tax=Pseudarthrobacter equi TaxID=728066 RepID=UPI0021C2485D|nr:hypothetical protein [Pseudarthrobacter equi]MCT9625608.1 hypothetical protein [Pseudarthrobacter equi]